MKKGRLARRAARPPIVVPVFGAVSAWRLKEHRPEDYRPPSVAFMKETIIQPFGSADFTAMLTPPCGERTLELNLSMYTSTGKRSARPFQTLERNDWVAILVSLE